MRPLDWLATNFRVSVANLLGGLRHSKEKGKRKEKEKNPPARASNYKATR